MAAPCATLSPRYRWRTSYLVATVVATVVIGGSAAAAVEEPEVTRIVAGTVQNVTVDVAPGSAQAADVPLPVEAAVEIDGELYDLPDGSVPALATGDAVEVTLRSDADLTVDEALELASAGATGEAGVVSVDAAPQLAAAVTAGALGAHTLTVLPVYWATPDAATTVSLRTLADQSAGYWSEQTAGRLSVQSVDVRGWAAVPAPTVCDRDSAYRLFDAALAANGVPAPTGRQHVIVYFPAWSSCGWAGMAAVNGGTVWINGNQAPDILTHELGHNFGLGHANIVSCTSGGVVVPVVLPFSGCTTTEYGDYADVMGIAMSGAPTGSLNSAMADALGLTQLTDVSALAGSTVLDLAPLTSVSAHRAARVQAPGGRVYVDYRPAQGRDVRWSRWAGVQVHVQVLDTRNIPSTYLLDMQPTTGSFVNASFPVGQAWTVPGTALTLTVQSAGSTARLGVAAGQAAPAGGAVPAGQAAPAGQVGPDPVANYVRRVYQDLFLREPDPTGLQGWMSALNTGTPRMAVANAITSSTEYRSRLITASYNTYLGRDPDPVGLDGWLAAMEAGITIQQMEAGFTASSEYYARAGGTDAQWVRQVYADVLGRGAADAEVEAWTGVLRQPGASRQTAAIGFLVSTEHLADVVDGHYQHLLGRGIDPVGRQGWVGAIQAGVRVEAVIGGIIASDEYINRG